MNLDSHCDCTWCLSMKQNFSLSTLLFNLINRAPKQPLVLDEQEPENKKVATTIRLDHATRKFLEVQAEHLGISVQEFISMTFKAIMQATLEPQASELDLMADRVVEAFTVHGVAIADIPSLLPSGSLQRSDFLNRADLINKLNPKLIQHIADLFDLNPEWLKGVQKNSQIVPKYRWYKGVSSFAFRLSLLKHNARRVRVLFVAENGITLEALAKAKRDGDEVASENIGVVIEKEFVINDINYTSFEVWESERWNYWRCRYCLKAMMMFCEKTGVPYDGITLPKNSIRELFYGNSMAKDIITRYDLWYPDTMLWDDPQNLERDELETIKKYYAETKAEKYELAIQRPYLVKDWAEFERGFIEYKSIELL